MATDDTHLPVQRCKLGLNMHILLLTVVLYRSEQCRRDQDARRGKAGGWR